MSFVRRFRESDKVLEPRRFSPLGRGVQKARKRHAERDACRKHAYQQQESGHRKPDTLAMLPHPEGAENETRAERQQQGMNDQDFRPYGHCVSLRKAFCQGTESYTVRCLFRFVKVLRKVYTDAMNRKKPIAVFDIDGTIFRSSLLIQLNDALVKQGVFPESARDSVLGAREAWLDRAGSYDNYINTIVQLYARDVKGTRVADIRRVSRIVISEQKHRVYVFTRELVKKLRRTHALITISYSPIEAVEAFNAFYKFDVVSGVVYPNSGGRYTGTVALGEAPDKKRTLTRIIDEYGFSLKGSVGIGDSESDIAFLQMVERPIAFNPNKILYRHAVRKKWEIVVERKDVIYHL